MKKLLIASLVLFLLSGCKCLIAQIPNQYIYSGANCEAPLPNYLPWVYATDNCLLASIVQTPAAGTILNPQNMIANVVIRATDASGNSSQITFNVMLIDTVPPIITVDDTLLTADIDVIFSLYNQADKIILSKLENFDATFPYSAIGIPLDTAQYRNSNLIMVRSPFKAPGEVERVFSFYCFSDTTNN
jgi:hypothetical protein